MREGGREREGLKEEERESRNECTCRSRATIEIKGSKYT